MDTSRFDRISRIFAQRRDARRQATPAATEGTPPVAEWTGEKTPYLFIQSFQSGSLAPTDDPDRHTLTLEAGLGQTVYFADRPSRDVGVTPTPQLLRTLGFSDENPPNAALMVDAGNGETDLAVVELFDPVYDETTHTATYQVCGLEAWEHTLSLGLQQESSGLASIASEFGTAHLLIDDCSTLSVICIYGQLFMPPQYLPPVPYCYTEGYCLPCEPYRGQRPPDICDVFDYWADKCNEAYPGLCVGQCRPLFEGDTAGLCLD